MADAPNLLDRVPRADHEARLRRAIANSRKAGLELKTGGAFGAVIVDASGSVLADGWNQVIARSDPTWHAEVHAIREACAALKAVKLPGSILYSSSEPCPMCLAAAYWAGIGAIAYAATVDDARTYGDFDDSTLYDEIRKPPADRPIPCANLLRDEAVEVWKEYHARPDRPRF